MKRTVLIMGEGPTDVGSNDGVGGFNDGPVIKYLNKFNNSLEFIPLARGELRASTVPKKNQGKFTGHGKVIQKMIIHSQLQSIKYDVLVYFADTDKKSGTNNTEIQATRQSKEAYQEVEKVAEYFSSIKIVPIIPLRMLEAWLLADERAFQDIYEKKVDPFPTKPEFLWGNEHDPNSNHPKNVLRRILTQLGDTPCRETFNRIAESTSITTLTARCPLSAVPFEKKAREYLTDHTAGQGLAW